MKDTNPSGAVNLDHDLTFELNILMDHIRGMATMLEESSEFYANLEMVDARLQKHIITASRALLLFADQGDSMAEKIAAELNSAKQVQP